MFAARLRGCACCVLRAAPQTNKAINQWHWALVIGRWVLGRLGGA
jgi:hypothetical protein